MCTTFILCLLYTFIYLTGLVDLILSSSLLYLNIFGCEMKHLRVLLDKLGCLTFLFPPCFIGVNFSCVFTLAFPHSKWRVANYLIWMHLEMKGIAGRTGEHEHGQWSVKLHSRLAAENVKQRQLWLLFAKMSLPGFPETTECQVDSRCLSEHKCTNMHTQGDKEGANLPSTLVIHHMITSHPKCACVYKDPSGPRPAGFCWQLHHCLNTCVCVSWHPLRKMFKSAEL